MPWLAPVASAVLMVMAGAAGYSAESGSRAGAEPVLAALLIGAPFAVLTLVDFACAIALSVPWSRAVHLGALTLQTLASAALLAAVVALDGTPGLTHETVVAVLLLGPAAVTWLWISSHRPSEV